MRPIFATVAATLFGLFITWLSLYTWSYVNFQVPDRIATGCFELEHCPDQWWTYPLLFTLLLGPALVMGCAGYLASSKRWTVRRVGVVFAGLTIITVLLHSIEHILPFLYR
jgi:hypothetical protein